MNERFSINETFVQPYSFPSPVNWKSPKPWQRMAASVNCKKGDAKFPTAQLSRQKKKRKNETKRSDESRSKNFLGGIYKEN